MRMTTTSGPNRRPMHFPPPGIVVDSTSTIVPPSAQDIVRLAADVAPKALPEFVRGLVASARRRRYQPRYRALNRARLELARLCIDRMLLEGLDVPDDDHEAMDADEPKSPAAMRDVPIAPHLVVELKKWKLASQPNAANLVFAGNRGAMVQQACIQQSWQRLQRRVANGGQRQTALPRERYHFHALRHVCASLWIESGLPAKRIQYLMGHSSIQMTFDTYGHLFDDPGAVQTAMAKIGADLIR